MRRQLVPRLLLPCQQWRTSTAAALLLNHRSLPNLLSPSSLLFPSTFSRPFFSWGKKGTAKAPTATADPSETSPTPPSPPIYPAAPPNPLRPLTSSLTPSPAPPRPSRSESPSISLPPLFVSRATRSYSLARHRNIAIAPTKLNDICRFVRGLSVDESIIQCRLSPKKKAVFVGNAIRAAAVAGVNNFQMEWGRLYVAEAWVGRGICYKRVEWKGRGKVGMIQRYHSHLTVIVREQPTMLEVGAKLPGMWGVQTKATRGSSHRGGIEVRIGRRGRKIHTVEKQKERLRLYAEEKQRRGQKVPLTLIRRKAVVLRA